MDLRTLRALSDDPSVRAAALGGLFGFALQTHRILTAAERTSYSLGVVFAASFLAGFLARRHGGRSRSAGVAAATLAVLPAVASLSTPTGYFTQTYGVSGLGMAAATAVLFLGFIGFVAAATGTLGGDLGGWIESRSPV
ncbi:DUF5518 domain-containing protein [Halocalculus aciditolerans]|uniref:DUF5518 domain-containing protein n=1 Tax=Halocalculus aciditolerans TaxID=1383812 RepID=UPI00166E488E|nr:DUF5518 domain-containing protein [Halocalculus aciditolerans]